MRKKRQGPGEEGLRSVAGWLAVGPSVEFPRVHPKLGEVGWRRWWARATIHGAAEMLRTGEKGPEEQGFRGWFAIGQSEGTATLVGV